MMEGIIYKNGFIDDSMVLFDELKNTLVWDTSMKSRKTASLGVAYNYSQMTYPHQEMPKRLNEICNSIETTLGFKPNNCLVNYYHDGTSKMGFHSDRTDNLIEKTGVVIISLGLTRILRFRNIANKEIKKDYTLISGSLLFMTLELQNDWQHAIPKYKGEGERISLTFREVI